MNPERKKDFKFYEHCYRTNIKENYPVKISWEDQLIRARLIKNNDLLNKMPPKRDIYVNIMDPVEKQDININNNNNNNNEKRCSCKKCLATVFYYVSSVSVVIYITMIILI